MHFSRNSQSRSKIGRKKYECLPSVDVLHNGLRRRISQKQYKSLYPRLRINDSSRVNTITVLQTEFNEEYIYEEVLNMRQQNRKLQQENELLRTNIRRSNKLNDLFERRRENQQLHEMQFQKIVELKLLLQSEELEEEFARCEHRWKATQKEHKSLKNSIKNGNFQSQINFINLLTEIGFEAGEMKNKNEQKLNNLNDQLTRIKLKTRKLKQLLKSKMEESKKLSEQIELQKKKLPATFDSSISVSDSGVMSLQIRNKSIDEIETQIVKIKEQTQKFEETMQNQIDSYVLAKIILYKEIDELKAQLVQKRVNNSRTFINW